MLRLQLLQELPDEPTDVCDFRSGSPQPGRAGGHAASYHNGLLRGLIISIRWRRTALRSSPNAPRCMKHAMCYKVCKSELHRGNKAWHNTGKLPGQFGFLGREAQRERQRVGSTRLHLHLRERVADRGTLVPQCSWACCGRRRAGHFHTWSLPDTARTATKAAGGEERRGISASNIKAAPEPHVLSHLLLYDNIQRTNSSTAITTYPRRKIAILRLRLPVP